MYCSVISRWLVFCRCWLITRERMIVRTPAAMAIHPIMVRSTALHRSCTANARIAPTTSRKIPLPRRISVPPCWRTHARSTAVSYTHLRAHETRHDLVCRLLLEKKKPRTQHDNPPKSKYQDETKTDTEKCKH